MENQPPSSSSTSTSTSNSSTLTSTGQLTAKRFLMNALVFLANNWKKIVLITALVAAVLFGLSVKVAKYVEKPEFCKTCHSMKPFYSSWSDSTHKTVSCFSCHFGYTPVVKPKPLPVTQKKRWVIELQNRTIDVSKQMNYIKNHIVSFNVRIYNFRIWFSEAKSKAVDLRKVFVMAVGGSTSGDNADFWNNCIKCHQETFSSNSRTDSYGHEKHLKQKMVCTDCHHNIVHGRKLPRTSSECVKCHDNMPRPSSHRNGLFGVSHGQSFLKVGSCQICHVNGIKEQLCTNCHGMQMPHSEDYLMYHIEDIHKVNINTCLRCHKDNNQIIGGVQPKAMSCNKCHGPDLPHRGYQSILRSHGSLAIKKGTKGCLSCHIAKQCTDCHGMPIPHTGGFLKQHSNEAKQYGFDKCLKCHDSYGGKAMSCIGCHVVQMPHPPDWNSTHGPKKDQNCNYCHSRKNPVNPGAPWAGDNFCQKCHYKKDHREDHARQAGLKLEDCQKCHGESGCTKCHGKF